MEINDKKAMTRKALNVLLIVALILLGYALIDTFSYLKEHEVGIAKIYMTDPNFEVSNLEVGNKNITFNVKRLGGMEDYLGFQVFIEDSYGKVTNEAVYFGLNVSQSKKVSVNYKRKVSNVMEVNVIPIF